MKHTPLSQKHIDLGAKMVDFAGYYMPVSYKGIKDEHLAVRNSVGVFDVSHMGEFIVKGEKAFDLVQYITSNDVSRLDIGQVQYSCFPNADKGIVDDLLVYRLAEDKCAEDEQAYMLVVNASNLEKDWAWVEKHNEKFGAQLTNISDQTGLIAVQGPKSAETLQKLTDINLSELTYYTFTKGTIAGIDNVLISATGYTGERGFELYVAADNAPELWDAVMEAGKEFDIEATGLGARDTLRLEMGYCLYGNDIDENTSALEAGLGWITKLKKSAFVQQDFLVQQKADGLTRRLIGFEVEGKRPARQGYPILNEAKEVIGHVTSGTKSPSMGSPIGMGYVAKGNTKSGTAIFIDVRGKHIPAKVVKRPFYKEGSLKM